MRRALESFGQDLRMASAINYNGWNSVTLTVPYHYDEFSNQVTYYYDDSEVGDSETAGCFLQLPGASSSDETPTILARDVVDFDYYRYDRLDQPAVTNNTTKRIRISMIVRIQAGTTISENVVSASFVMRNKPVN